MILKHDTAPIYWGLRIIHTDDLILSEAADEEARVNNKHVIIELSVRKVLSKR